MSLPPSEIPLGAMTFNSDSRKLEYWMGSAWMQIHTFSPNLGGISGQSGSIDGTGTRALFAGGYIAPGPCFNNVDAITVETQGNTIDFNNLTANKCGGYGCADRTRAIYAGGRVSTTPGGSSTNDITSCTISIQNDFVNQSDLTASRAFGTGFSSATRAVFAGQAVPSYGNTIDFTNIQSLGDAVDFGDTAQKNAYAFSTQSPTRGFVIGGLRVNAPDTADYNTIEMFTTATTGSGVDFGDITTTRYEGGGGGNATRGIIAGGYGPNYTNRIEFFTLASFGNTSNFGDLSDANNGTGKYSASSPTRFVVGGGYGTSPHYGNTLEYVNIATQGDSVDFGDFINFGRRSLGDPHISNGHGGLG